MSILLIFTFFSVSLLLFLLHVFPARLMITSDPHVTQLTSTINPHDTTSTSTGHDDHRTQRYSYYFNRWNKSSDPMIITYVLLTDDINIDYIGLDVIKSVLRRAFQQWANVAPVKFKEAEKLDATPDIRIGFFRGDHGDGLAFDGPSGTTAHTTGTQNGEIHLDGDETWSVDFELEKSERAMDLESVLIHESGHILGLGHSSDKNAVMYPTLAPRTKKVNLGVDDVEGIQSLYGPNHGPTNPDLADANLPPWRSSAIGIDQGIGGWVVTCLVIINVVVSLVYLF